MYLVGASRLDRSLRSISSLPTSPTRHLSSHLTVFGPSWFGRWRSDLRRPRAFQRELWSSRWGIGHYGWITVGITTMGLVLTAAGLQQAFSG